MKNLLCCVESRSDSFSHEHISFYSPSQTASLVKLRHEQIKPVQTTAPSAPFGISGVVSELTLSILIFSMAFYTRIHYFVFRHSNDLLSSAILLSDPLAKCENT